jgi:hypothetical protein
MPDLKTILSDENFLALPEQEKIKVVSAVDSNFGALPDAEKVRVFQLMGGKPAQEPQPVAPKEEDTLGKIGEKLSERGEKIADFASRQYEGGVAQGIFKTPQIIGATAGQVAGGALDAIGVAAGKLISEGTPEGVKDFAKDKSAAFAQTEVGKMAISALQGGAESWKSFSESYPEAAIAAEGIFNVATIAPINRGASAALREGADTVSDISRAVSNINPKIIDNKILSEVRAGVQKGARPGVEGKRTFGQASKYWEDAASATESIVKNKSQLSFVDEAGEKVVGQLPKNLEQFSQAIDQTKKSIFDQYDKLASETGTKLNVNDIVKELEKIQIRKDIRAASPETAVYAKKKIADLQDIGELSAAEAQDTIKVLNSKLQAFYKNPSHADAGTVAVDKLIADKLRTQIDDAIKAATGKEYGQLKREYGALSAIERDVNRRMIVDLRKNAKGLADFSDMFSGAQAVYSVVSQNPASFAAAVTTKGISRLIKSANDPNKAIEKMFQNVDGLVAQKGEFVPKSYAGRQVHRAVENLNMVRNLPEINPTVAPLKYTE